MPENCSRNAHPINNGNATTNMQRTRGKNPLSCWANNRVIAYVRLDCNVLENMSRDVVAMVCVCVCVAGYVYSTKCVSVKSIHSINFSISIIVVDAMRMFMFPKCALHNSYI